MIKGCAYHNDTSYGSAGIYIIGSALSVPYLLVIQYNIWSPDVVGRHMQLLYAPVLVGVPNQFVVVPKLKEEAGKISLLGLGQRLTCRQRKGRNVINLSR